MMAVIVRPRHVTGSYILRLIGGRILDLIQVVLHLLPYHIAAQF